MSLAVPVPMTALHHLGSLHSYETALVLLLAFGPFLVIVGLVVRERRRDDDVPEEPSGVDSTSASR